MEKQRDSVRKKGRDSERKKERGRVSEQVGGESLGIFVINAMQMSQHKLTNSCCCTRCCCC